LRFGALIPDNAYGHLVETAFQQAVKRNGGEIVALKRFKPTPNGMMKPIEEISVLARTVDKETREPLEPQIDALFIPASRRIMDTLGPALPYYEIDTRAVKLIGTGAWDYARIGREKALRKGWYPGPDPKGWRKFSRRYSSTYGKAPPRIASLAYDAVSLAVALSRGSGPHYSPARLTRPSGFAGVDGLFRLDADGGCERGLAILEIGKFAPRVIDRAPTVFTHTASAAPSNARPTGGFSFNPFQ